MGRTWGFKHTDVSTSSTTSGRKDTFTSSETKSVSCEGSIVLPPGHKTSYTLAINQEELTFQTTHTLELILCSAYRSLLNIN